MAEGWKDLVVNLEALGKHELKVGWFDSSKYEDGTPVAYIASIQEFGAAKKSIPPRPFMRPAIAGYQAEWSAAAVSGFKAVADGRYTALQVLDLIGNAAAGAVRQHIAELNTPALSPITLLLRKRRKEGGTVTGKTVGEAAREANAGPPNVSGVSTKPLVDSTLMMTTLTHQVK